MTLGPTLDFMIPLTRRPNEIVNVPSLYFGIGPFASFKVEPRPAAACLNWASTLRFTARSSWKPA